MTVQTTQQSLQYVIPSRELRRGGIPTEQRSVHQLCTSIKDGIERCPFSDQDAGRKAAFAAALGQGKQLESFANLYLLLQNM
jgi:hypothetical protein